MPNRVLFDYRVPGRDRPALVLALAPLAEAGVTIRVEDPADQPQLGWRVCASSGSTTSFFRMAKDATAEDWTREVAATLQRLWAAGPTRLL